MHIKHILKIALHSLRRHKSRSLLTMLGIVIGVSSIMVIVSMGNAAEAVIGREITSLGADIIWIEPGREPEGLSDFSTTILSNTLKHRDIEFLRRKENVPGVKQIVPAVSVPGSMAYQGDTYRPLIMGFSAEFMGEIFDFQPEEGVFFDDIAIRNRERVVVIGARVKEELFGQSDAVGKIVKINEKAFRVVGVLPDQGQIFFFDLGTIAIVPYTTAQTYLLGIDYYNEVWVRVNDVDAVPATVRDIEITLRELHNITDPSKDDFYILTQDNLLNQIGGILSIFTAALSAIVAIALVVGGVGVMNIMLVSVAERTREIGLRKAIGATNKDIRTQFLLEAIILTGLGGVAGVIIGALLSALISFGIAQAFNFNLGLGLSVSATLLGIGVSSFVGLIFGFYPARQASLKSPMEAIRYE